VAKEIYEEVVLVNAAIVFVVSFAIVVALAVVTASSQLRGDEGPKTGGKGFVFAKRRVGRIDERERSDRLRGRPGSSLGE
jgi:hypothetical protein